MLAIYRCLLYLYPSAYREEYGEEMMAVFYQVEAAMGKPEKKVTLGNKVIYYYKDMKVIFLSGKVSDVQ